MQSGTAAAQGRLAVFARMLWGASPALHALPPGVVPRRARIDGDDWYLPAEPDAPRLGFAQVAHAAAHRRYGAAPMERAGLHAMQQILLGLLEDARVEWLAMRALPGLRALWAPFHCADITLTPTLDALFERLARALFDPAALDPHPWVVKGRGLFFAGSSGDGWRPPEPEALRRIASILGNDLGQLRLRLNAGVFEIRPVYRDDNAHLWTTPPDADAVPLPQAARPTDGERNDTPPDAATAEQAQDDSPGRSDQPDAGRTDAATPGAGSTAVRLLTTREWDYRIRRYRDAWCTVRVEVPAALASGGATSEPIPLADQLLARRLLAPRHRSQTWRRSERGHLFHLPAVIDARAARRRQEQADPRLFRVPLDRQRIESVAVVLDVSASTAHPGRGPGTQTVLDRMRRLAFALADGVLRSGGRCAVLAFASNTRAQVRMQRLRDFAEPSGAAALHSRLDQLSPRWSTRLGAAVRGAAALLAEEPAGGTRRLVLLTDGQPHDVDSHDPRYLLEDLRRARREAAVLGVDVVTVDPQTFRL